MTKIPTGRATTSMQNATLFHIPVVMCSAGYVRTLSCTNRRLLRSLHATRSSLPALRFLCIVILVESEQIQKPVKTTQLRLTKANNTKQTDAYLMQSGMSVAC